MPKKSKPKQRTNWKQRALHCEEVLDIQHTVARTIETRMEREISEEKQNTYAATVRAELAEKHNALLLEEREQTKNKQLANRLNRPDDYEFTYAEPSSYTMRVGDPVTVNLANYRNWQRFKSWLGGWYVELLCLMVVICAVAGFVAYAWIRSL